MVARALVLDDAQRGEQPGRHPDEVPSAALLPQVEGDARAAERITGG